MRFLTYPLPLSDRTRSYLHRVVASQAAAAWIGDALAEQDYFAFDEPYRTHR